MSFHAKKDHLGELVEMVSDSGDGGGDGTSDVKVMTIQETPSRTLSVGSSRVSKVIFLPEGRLASCSEEETIIKVWDIASSQELFTLLGHTRSVWTISLLPNGWLASGSRDSTIKLWDLEEKREVRTLRGHGPTVDFKVLKNGNLVSYSFFDVIQIWNPYLSENNLLVSVKAYDKKSQCDHLGVLSNDFLITYSREFGNDDGFKESILSVWDSNDGQLVKSLPTGLNRVSAVLALANGQVAVAAIIATSSVYALSNGGKAVIGTADHTIKIVDLEDERESRVKLNAHDHDIFRLLQLSNGNLVSAGRDKDSSGEIHSIKVWNLADLSLLQHIKTDHSDRIVSLSISHDETLLASGGRDGTIKLWPISINGAHSS